ncbi:MAG: hypothetical protein HKN26_04705, partial [Acidimicrobiales bacterium]|nr:hypothetical protein [Acidimicrobiales bacterium]
LIGVQFAPPVSIDADGSFGPYPADARADATGLAPHPEALPPLLHRVAEAVPGRSLAVSLLGVATDDDDWRHELLTAQVGFVREAVDDGVPLVGAFFEPGIDGYEPATGFGAPRGLLDRDRRPKPSAQWFFDQLP